MKLNDIRIGIKVHIIKLESTSGMIVAQEHLNNRKLGLTGIVRCCVAGHGGDAWFIEHDDKSIGAYCFTEFSETIGD